jgi:hypothetical protein
MFCSGCGHALLPGQPVCPQCGRPAALVVPPVPDLQFPVESYAGKLKALSIVCHLVWVSILVRTALALVAAWGLLERARWGRIFAIIVAILSLLKFPFGTALGIWTLVVLLGFRNSMLYQQIEQV